MLDIKLDSVDSVINTVLDTKLDIKLDSVDNVRQRKTLDILDNCIQLSLYCIATVKQLLGVRCKSISCLGFSNSIFFKCVAINK